VYGPHIASLYARATCLASSCSSLAHHFLSASAPGSANAYKLGGPSGPCYELASSGPAIVAYLRSLTPEGTLAAAGEAIAAQEKALLEVLLGFLTSPAMHARGVRIVGSAKNDAARVPTVSFLVLGERAMPSRALVGAIDRTGGIGIRFGHFYAYTLVSELAGMRDVEDGVVRISLVHYNTVEEVERLVRAIEQVLA
jgi:selenocysteine lyase/cysteine desulfurase